MTVSNNKVVSVSYTLHNKNAQGDVIEQTAANAPFHFSVWRRQPFTRI